MGEPMVHVQGRGTFRTCEDAVAYLESLLDREQERAADFQRRLDVARVDLGECQERNARLVEALRHYAENAPTLAERRQAEELLALGEA